ncbi:sperm acrosome membrane-associated protein 6 isoform X4 [Talpa occidentalis]|uniref:sperm acrosome membrane-associated protein 6 isoform X4 n=1 Tax=Talpa occidentalis TaxID=50954 RepID=UPI001890108F|nr:sperm acrosome membrane-associated protein 6 isoform X4 [Talpa occidentalis]
MAPMAPAALVALAALGTPAWACFFCLTTHQDRLRICQIFSGWNAKVTDNCYRRLLNTFKPTEKAEINYHELSRLHDNFTQIVLKLEDIASYSRGFIMAFLSAKEKALEAIAELKPPQDCVPPCGFQELARRFRCSGCYSYICDYPLDCPVQDVTVIRGEQAMFSCSVNFLLPPGGVAYSWKFAVGIRTQDQSFFRDLPRAVGHVARVRPVQPTHRGTFCCVIQHDDFPVARLYFYLNVTGPPPRGETELQGTFREVLQWGPRDADLVKPWNPSLGELLARPDALTPGNKGLLAAVAALASASATLLAWVFFRWYCSGSSQQR